MVQVPGEDWNHPNCVECLRWFVDNLNMLANITDEQLVFTMNNYHENNHIEPVEEEPE